MDELIQESQNRFLYRKRKELGLSRNQLAKKAHLTKWTIFNLEYGYIRFTDKRIERLSLALGVEKEEFNKRSTVPETVEEVDNHKNYELMKKLLLRKVTLIVSIIVLVLSIPLSIVFGTLYFTKYQSAEYTLGKDLITIRQKTLDEGEYIKINARDLYLNLIAQDFYCYEQEITSNGVIYNNELYFSNKKMEIYGFYSEFPDISEGYNKITFNYSFEECTFVFYEDDETYFTLVYDIENFEKGRKYKSLDSDSPVSSENWSAYNVENEYFKRFINLIETKEDTYFAGLNTVMGDIISKEDFKFESFMSTQSNEEEKFSVITIVCAVLFILGVTLGIVSIIVLISIAAFYSAHKYRTEKIESYISEPDRTYKIKNNFKLGPPLKESFFRTIGVVIIFFANLALFFYIGNLLGLINIDQDNFFIKNASFIKGLVGLGQIIILTVSLKIFTNGDNLVLKALMFLLLGVIYYLGMITLLWSEFGTGIVIDLLIPYLPTNIFWSIAVFAFTCVFLFLTPTKCDTKVKKIIWRSQIIWPLAYVIIGSIIKYMFKVGQLKFHESLLFLLPNKPLLVTIYGELLVIAIFVFERIIAKRHNEEYLVEYRNTNQYFWIFNIIACTLIALIAVLDNVVTFKGQGVFYWGKMNLVWVLIPLVLMYRPRINKAKLWQTGLYGLGILIASMIGITLITIFFMIGV